VKRKVQLRMVLQYQTSVTIETDISPDIRRNRTIQLIIVQWPEWRQKKNQLNLIQLIIHEHYCHTDCLKFWLLKLKLLSWHRPTVRTLASSYCPCEKTQREDYGHLVATYKVFYLKFNNILVSLAIRLMLPIWADIPIYEEAYCNY
jgi:hypothetical protein